MDNIQFNQKNKQKNSDKNPNINENAISSEELRDLYDIKYALDQSAIVAITDPKGNIRYVNDLFCEITGYMKEELIGKNHRILNSGLHSKEYFKNMYRTIGTGNVWKGEFRNKKKDGSYYWVHSTIVPFLNEKGKPYQYISIRTDITKEKLLEEEIRKSNEKYRLIAENSSDLISIIEENGDFVYVSPSYTSLLGYNLPHLESGNLFDLIAPRDIEFVKEKITSCFNRAKDKLQIEFQLQDVYGKLIDVEASFNIVKSHDDSNKDLLTVVIRDIRDRKKIEEEINYLAYHDSLTGLPNRRLFMSNLRTEILDQKFSRSKLALLFIDIDNFKTINDECGHDIADQLLVEIARKLKKSLKPQDLIARLGGDEFIILLKNIDSKTEIEAYLNELLQNAQQPIVLGKDTHYVNFSVGVAIFPEHGKNGEDLLKNADAALHLAKKQGKNGYAFYDIKLENESLEKRLLENTMRDAIVNQQFYLEYQPKLNIKTGQLIGMEALVRWNHPVIGRIPPGKFIPLAEETGMIIPLGEWILRESCEQIVKWQEMGYPYLPVSVNVSVRQLDDNEFINKVEKILKETQINPAMLEMEVTESVFADVKNAAEILQQIRNLGIQVSIDDFGTGYSSLTYIKHLPIDTLKVDQSFVKDIHVNEESRAIIKAVITLANSIGINVIAEGVEMKEHVVELVNEGCKLGQGYYFSKPLCVQDFEQFMQQHYRVKEK